MHKLDKKQLIMFLGLIMLLCISHWGIYGMGYKNAIGVYPTFPFAQREASPMPPAMNPTEQTFEDVGDFIANDITNKEPFQEGMNCVDLAFSMQRNAEWEGLGTLIIGLEYEVGPGHILLLFPTADQGCILVDPQSDKMFGLMQVGDTYNGKVITGINVMRIEWVPIEEFLVGGNSSE